jgi:hypothetical protein
LLLPIIITVLACAACTPEQTRAWKHWYRNDPEAAVAFLDTPEYAELEDDQAAAPAPPAPSPARTESVSGGGVWDRIAQCESGGNWSINTGNGYYGGLQFTLGSWRAAGGSGMPHQASRSEQIRVAENLKDMQGWGAWPACTRKLGLR